MPLEFNDILKKTGIDPGEVLVMRHRPWEPTLRRAFAWIAAERPDLFKTYQSAQLPRAEAAMAKAGFVAGLIGNSPGRATFISLYKVAGSKRITAAEYAANPLNAELCALGMSGTRDAEDWTTLWFDLVRRPELSEYEGRLDLNWTGGERSWFRWSHRNNFPIAALHEKNAVVADMPDWRELVLSWAELRALPREWADRIRQWRGVYLIVDTGASKKGAGVASYVGSAYGEENILGRWLNYAQSGHGGNRGLRKSIPEDLRFAILERVSPDAEAANVINAENAWKTRLHTREFGLNEN